MGWEASAAAAECPGIQAKFAGARPPSREQLAELARLFDPSASPSDADRIVVDAQSRIYLTRPTEIDPAMAVEAHVPTGVSVGLLRADSGPVCASGYSRPEA